jgi:hypothetical protein
MQSIVDQDNLHGLHGEISRLPDHSSRHLPLMPSTKDSNYWIRVKLAINKD